MVAPGSLAETLRTARIRSFVGREAELDVFRAALEGSPSAPAVMFVHGPGGVGKSALLRRFADEADARGVPVVQVDARWTDQSPAGFAAAAASVGAHGGGVLLIDSFQDLRGLEDWLRDHFLPSLPAGIIVTVAGREPPGSAWTSDLSWEQALRVMPLGDLGSDDAGKLLQARQVPAAAVDAVLRFAGGHPLVLNVAASLAVDGEFADGPWEPSPDVLRVLLSRVVGDVPTVAHRTSLEVAAHCMRTTEPLLRSVVDTDQASELFAWLRRLPFVESTPQGLVLHDLASDLIDRDARWRDRAGYEENHRRLARVLLERARAATGADVSTAMHELLYLKGSGALARYFGDMARRGEIYEDVLRPSDREAVLAMIESAEGAEQRAVGEFWIDHQPQAFWMYRRSVDSEIVGFMCLLEIHELEDEAARADPVVAGAWAATAGVAPLGTGEQATVARFIIEPASYGGISQAGHLAQSRIVASWVRSVASGWSVIVSHDDAIWADLMESIGHRRIGETIAIGRDAQYNVYACDWRVTSLERWFEHVDGTLTDRVESGDAGTPALDRAQFDQAVRDALRNLHRPDALAASPLISSRLMQASLADHAVNGSDVADVLRNILTAAVDALGGDPRDAKLQRVVATTFVQRVPTQEAAAERLDLPFSTYRRHLRRGLELVSENLWRRETGARPLAW